MKLTSRLRKIICSVGIVLLLATTTATRTYATSNSSHAQPDILPQWLLIKETQMAAKYALLTNWHHGYFDYHWPAECVWWRMTWHGPTFKQTRYVREYLPDAIVSVYRQPPAYHSRQSSNGTNPIHSQQFLDPVITEGSPEDELFWDPLYGSTEAGSGDAGSTPNNESVRFFDVDIWPNIEESAFMFFVNLEGASSIPPLVHSERFIPFYSSLYDKYFWHSPKAAIIADGLHWGTWKNILHSTIGTLTRPWGNLYPRDGFVNESSQYRAAAVDALRALSIMFEDYSVRTTAGNRWPSGVCGDGHCTADRGKITKGKLDATQIKLQRIYPDYTTKITQNFGQPYTIKGPNTKSNKYRKDGGNNYAWLVWRHYQGCLPPGGGWIYLTQYPVPH